MAEKLTINQWAEEDRPREKMMLHGVGTLSDAELLAILIGSGNTEDSAVELMRKVFFVTTILPAVCDLVQRMIG